MKYLLFFICVSSTLQNPLVCLCNQWAYALCLTHLFVSEKTQRIFLMHLVSVINPTAIAVGILKRTATNADVNCVFTSLSYSASTEALHAFSRLRYPVRLAYRQEARPFWEKVSHDWQEIRFRVHFTPRGWRCTTSSTSYLSIVNSLGVSSKRFIVPKRHGIDRQEPNFLRLTVSSVALNEFLIAVRLFIVVKRP